MRIMGCDLYARQQNLFAGIQANSLAARENRISRC
jgi:hypothetical protein